jgi:hypothetical protein
VDALGDRIHASAGQPLLNELDDGFLKNVLAGLFRVVLATLARLDAGSTERRGVLKSLSLRAHGHHCTGGRLWAALHSEGSHAARV